MVVEDVPPSMKIDREVNDDSEHVNYNGEPREYTWSANLELPEHADNREKVVEEAKAAVRQTADGYFVNLVTHEAHGHPSGYLYSILEDEFDNARLEYVDQCGCGGYVTRVHVGEG